MKVRHIVMIGITAILFGALMTGVVQALDVRPEAAAAVATLENVRDYAPATDQDSLNYAVDAGQLFAGGPGSWTGVTTPQGIIVGAVAVDSQRPHIVYIGAANELTVFRTDNGGHTWMRVPLSDTPGGVTDIAVDGTQRIVYAGTDTAGVFRLRDVGSSMLVGGQLLLDEPVRQVATDSTGTALAFARTDSALYRADNFGLSWSAVDNLLSSPTSLAIANTSPATVYVGTVDRGVLTSTDGQVWTMSNEGLGMAPGTRLRVDALAVDPAQPEQVYVASSFLFGSTVVHQTPSRIASSTDAATSWDITHEEIAASVTELLPVSGQPGAVYALTTESRSPLALFDAPALAAGLEAVPSAAPAPSAATQIPSPWIIAAIAAVALGLAVSYELRLRSRNPLSQGFTLSPLDTQTVNAVG